ncbi:hypothetical protein EV424DRAFT_1541840 [Suillus variegatus]|nr:hypothetical protein EV424DRAFT_1541840 [Suillus variegatus]
MSSTLRQPAFASTSPTFLPNLMDNSQAATNLLNCDAWRSNVSPSCPRDVYPSPPISNKALREPQIMESLHLLPYWETRHHSDLTIALISAQCLEHRAECRLIRRCLKHAMIEQELYSQMEQHRSHKLHKADTGIGISRGVLCISGHAPAGMIFDDADSDVSSMASDSDIGLSS